MSGSSIPVSVATVLAADSTVASLATTGVSVEGLWVPIIKSSEDVEAHQPLMLAKVTSTPAGATVEEVVTSRKQIAKLMGIIAPSLATMSVGTACVPVGFTHFYVMHVGALSRKKLPAGTVLIRRVITMDQAVTEGSAVSQVRLPTPPPPPPPPPKPKMVKVYRRGKTGGLQVRWVERKRNDEDQDVADGRGSGELDDGAPLTISDILGSLNANAAAATRGASDASEAGIETDQQRTGRLSAAVINPELLALADGEDDDSEEERAAAHGETAKRGRDEAALDAAGRELDATHLALCARRHEDPLTRAILEMREAARRAAERGVTRKRELNRIQTQHKGRTALNPRDDIRINDTVWRRPTPNVLVSTVGPFTSATSSQAGGPTFSRSLLDKSRVAAFGIEGTIMKTSLFERGAKAYSVGHPSVPDSLRQLAAMGYHIAFFANYPSLHSANAFLLEEKTMRIVNFVRDHCPELAVSVVLSVVSNAAAPSSREALPSPEVFRIFVRACNFAFQPDVHFSFFVGALDGGALAPLGGGGGDGSGKSRRRSQSIDSFCFPSSSSSASSSDGDDDDRVEMEGRLPNAVQVGRLGFEVVDNVEKMFADNIGLTFYSNVAFFKRELPCFAP